MAPLHVVPAEEQAFRPAFIQLARVNALPEQGGAVEHHARVFALAVHPEDGQSRVKHPAGAPFQAEQIGDNGVALPPTLLHQHGELIGRDGIPSRGDGQQLRRLAPAEDDVRPTSAPLVADKVIEDRGTRQLFRLHPG